MGFKFTFHSCYHWDFLLNEVVKDILDNNDDDDIVGQMIMRKAE